LYHPNPDPVGATPVIRDSWHRLEEIRRVLISVQHLEKHLVSNLPEIAQHWNRERLGAVD
jgi:hypothetical protein